MSTLLTLCASLALMTDPQTESKRPTDEAQSTAAAKRHVTKRPITSSVSFAYYPVELEIATKTNAERARHGLPALELDPTLVQTSRNHAWWMTRNNNLQHGNYPVAENIAMGQSSSQQVVHDWMNSSGHRANILDRRHRRLGVAAYTTRSGTIYWCQQFSP
jgi:uncharacterized protein YkwD